MVNGKLSCHRLMLKAMGNKTTLSYIQQKAPGLAGAFKLVY